MVVNADANERCVVCGALAVIVDRCLEHLEDDIEDDEDSRA